MNKKEKVSAEKTERSGSGKDPPEKPLISEDNHPRAPQKDLKKTGDISEKRREREETSDLWWRFAVKLLLIICIFAAVFRFVLGVQIQHGNRMYPFLMDGDLVVTFKLEEYREGDVVAYRRPDTGRIAISRIAAKGPCEIQISEDHLLVNGAIQQESEFYDTTSLAEYGIVYPYQLNESSYFLLDDNRTIGSDSRAFGEVRRWELLGKVVYVFRRRGI